LSKVFQELQREESEFIEITFPGQFRQQTKKYLYTYKGVNLFNNEYKGRQQLRYKKS